MKPGPRGTNRAFINKTQRYDNGLITFSNFYRRLLSRFRESVPVMSLFFKDFEKQSGAPIQVERAKFGQLIKLTNLMKTVAGCR